MLSLNHSLDYQPNLLMSNPLTLNFLYYFVVNNLQKNQTQINTNIIKSIKSNFDNLLLYEHKYEYFQDQIYLNITSNNFPKVKQIGVFSFFNYYFYKREMKHSKLSFDFSNLYSNIKYVDVNKILMYELSSLKQQYANQLGILNYCELKKMNKKANKLQLIVNDKICNQKVSISSDIIFINNNYIAAKKGVGTINEQEKGTNPTFSFESRLKPLEVFALTYWNYNILFKESFIFTHEDNTSELKLYLIDGKEAIRKYYLQRIKMAFHLDKTDLRKISHDYVNERKVENTSIIQALNNNITNKNNQIKNIEVYDGRLSKFFSESKQI